MTEKANLGTSRKGKKGERDILSYRTGDTEEHSSEVCGLQRQKKQ